MTAAASLTDDQLDRIYIAAQTGNLAELRRAIERELAASPAAAAGVPTAHTPAVKRLIAAARAAYDHRYQSGAPINSIYEELQLAAEDISSPVAPVGAPTLTDEQIDAAHALDPCMPREDVRAMLEAALLATAWQYRLRRPDGSYTEWSEPKAGPCSHETGQELSAGWIYEVRRQGCELATAATKQLREHSVHLAMSTSSVPTAAPLLSSRETERSELPREPLSEEEIRAAVRHAGLMFVAPDLRVARAIEAAHGIGGDTE